jgi:cytidylate kinase
MSSNVIAIDGPAASGKSTVARTLSERLKIPYVSTGSLYRAVAWKMLTRNLDPSSISAGELETFLANTSIACRSPEPHAPIDIEIDGVFLGEKLHTAEISAAASKVATYPEVRTWLLEVQRSMAGRYCIVMEGRDIGTAIFPDAKYKFFLTASPEVRAKRRLLQSGQPFDLQALDTVAKEIAARDEQDRSRKTAPLRQAQDAVYLDNSDMDLEQTLQFIQEAIRRKDILMSKETVLHYRVPYADTDQMGVVYYANYLKYFEMFRTEMLIAAGESYQKMEEHGYSLPVIEAVCRYKSPARFEDVLSVTGYVAECKGVRVRIECQIHRGDTLLAEGYTVHACINRAGRPVRVPSTLADLMPEKE